jgi:ferric-dicitrate binding protein FerR (iron transport regulator)
MRPDRDDDGWLRQIRQALDRSAAELPPDALRRLATARRKALTPAPRRRRPVRWLPPVAAAAALAAALLLLVNREPGPSLYPSGEIAAVVEDLDVVLSGEELLDVAMESEFYDWLAEVRPDAG